MTTSRHTETASLIASILQEALKPTTLAVEDQSSYHRDHKEARLHPEKGHFLVHISLNRELMRLSRLQQHKLIYQALEDIMDRIHALSIKVVTSE